MIAREADLDEERQFQQRFGELIDLVGGPTKAGKITGVARQTVDQWRKEGRRIPLTAAGDLARAGGRSLDWLMGNEIQSMTMQVQKDGSPVPDGYVSVPALSVRASAGGGQIAGPLDAIGGDVVALREDWMRSLGLHAGRTEALTAIGDSMEPTIRDGDFLLVDRSIDKVVSNGIYVLVYNGAVLVKRIVIRMDGTLTLKSDNSIYGEEIVSRDAASELIIEGRVRWHGRPM